MANEFYDHSTYPSIGASGSSSAMRAELELIEAGFAKLPTMAAKATYFVRVNAGATALEAVSDITGVTINNTIIGGTTRAAASFTTIAANGAVSFASTLAVTGVTTLGTLNATTSYAPTMTTVTAAYGASGVQVATLDFVNAVSINAAMPGAVGNESKEIVSDNVSAAWGYSGKRVARTSNTILAQADNRKFIDITSGTFTQTFTAAATIGDGWTCFIRNSGTGRITIPSSDGLTNWLMYPGESRLFQCDGTNFYSCWITPYQVEISSTETFIRPPGYSGIDLELWGAGGGGGAGDCSGPTAHKLGGGGGGGGGYWRRIFPYADITATVVLTIGAGGAGASGRSTTGDGSAGTVGENSTFGAYLTVTGGTGGEGGTASTGNSVSAVSGGYPLGGQDAPFTGGSGGATTNSSTTGGAGNGRPLAGTGGGNGGSENTSDALAQTGAGGSRNAATAGGGTAGTSSAGSPTSGGAGGVFAGGGGGGSAQSAAAGAGGAGGRASGGGGGGSSRTTYLSGAGGLGGNGYAILRGV